MDREENPTVAPGGDDSQLTNRFTPPIASHATMPHAANFTMQAIAHFLAIDCEQLSPSKTLHKLVTMFPKAELLFSPAF